MTPFTRRLSLAAAVLLGACADAPTVPVVGDAPRPSVAGGNGAQRFTYDEVYEFDGDSYFGFTCSDGTESELVQVFGRIAERFTFMVTPSGRIQLVGNTMPVGLYGVGVESGQEYRVVEREQGTAHYAPDGSGGGSMRETFLLRGRETRATFAVSYQVHWKFGEDGELVLERLKVSETCKP